MKEAQYWSEHLRSFLESGNPLCEKKVILPVNVSAAIMTGSPPCHIISYRIQYSNWSLHCSSLWLEENSVQIKCFAGIPILHIRNPTKVTCWNCHELSLQAQTPHLSNVQS